MRVAMGGTFDILHPGHEALLDAAFVLGGDVFIGLTTDAMALQGRPKVAPYKARKQRLEAWLAPPRAELMPVALSPVLKTPEEVEAGSPLFLDMVEDARILHDEDGFLAAYLEGLRQRLVALGSRRVWRGSTWHWVLKPDLKPGETITL